MPGYDRQNATHIGVGACEIILALVDHLVEKDSLRIGSVLRPYERSAYVRVRSDLTESLPFRGPRLILLGGRDFSGPLTMAVGNGPPKGFDPSGIEVGATSTLRAATTSTRDGVGYVLVVGDTLEVTIDQSLLQSGGSDITQIRDLSTIQQGGPSWRHGVETLDWLLESELTDGLGWASRLRAILDDKDGDAELEELAASWHRCLTQGVDGELPTPITDLLGRGPGATPSGDDILTGILLTLLHSTAEDQQRRVLDAGEKLVASATDRTTSISTALLAQAALGRSPDSVADAIRSLLQPSLDRQKRIAAGRALSARGHTSGVDILLGVLLTILLIGPAVEAER